MKRLLALAAELYRIDLAWRVGLYALIGATIIQIWIPAGGAIHVDRDSSSWPAAVELSAPAEPRASEQVPPGFEQGAVAPSGIGITYGDLREAVNARLQGRQDADVGIDNSGVEATRKAKSADEELLRLLNGK